MKKIPLTPLKGEILDLQSVILFYIVFSANKKIM